MFTSFPLSRNHLAVAIVFKEVNAVNDLPSTQS